MWIFHSNLIVIRPHQCQYRSHAGVGQSNEKQREKDRQGNGPIRVSSLFACMEKHRDDDTTVHYTHYINYIHYTLRKNGIRIISYFTLYRDVVIILFGGGIDYLLGKYRIIYPALHVYNFFKHATV